MTLHRAKGLEFDHVLLAGLEEGVWPNWQAVQQGAVAEERRLFYVGVTRARHSLQLSWVRHRREWAGKPSRFLAEIPKALTGAGAASWQAKGSGLASRTAAGRPAAGEATLPSRDGPTCRRVHGTQGREDTAVTPRSPAPALGPSCSRSWSPCYRHTSEETFR